jgi:RNA polymerase sigma-70 factor (ECF subfamily)
MSQLDAALILGFLNGDPDSTRQIDAWIAEVLRHRRLGLAGDVEDVAQQVRGKLFTSLRSGRFEGASTLRTYVWRAAQHTAIDHLRSRRTRPMPGPLDRIAEPADPTPSPEYALLRQERREIFAEVLARLGDECRELLQLIAFDELSYREIAARLRTTEGAIKVRALRCRDKAVAELKSVTSEGCRRPLPKDPV